MYSPENKRLEPENDASQKESPLPGVPFQVTMLVLGGVFVSLSKGFFQSTVTFVLKVGGLL